MTLHFHVSLIVWGNHRNNYNRTQWIEEKGDLTFQMIWFSRMHNHPIWLIEEEEDLFLFSFFQLYQSERMMMPLPENIYHHQNTTDRTQWIEGKWDLTFQMISYTGMHNYPIWLIEVQEDLFLISFFQLYLSTRMMPLHGLRHHRSSHHQYQAIQGKLDSTFQLLWPFWMHYHLVWLIEVEEGLLIIIQFFTPTNQGKWWCVTHPFHIYIIIVSTETRWTDFNGPNWRDVWYFKFCSHSECSFTQFNWVKLSKIYSSLYLIIDASQCEWFCSACISLVIVTIPDVLFWVTTETPLTKINWLKRSEIRHFEWSSACKCIVAQFDWLK